MKDTVFANVRRIFPPELLAVKTAPVLIIALEPVPASTYGITVPA
jgi:hypothetical protein